MTAKPQHKIIGVKLIRTYEHGWLWIEKRADSYWRLRFGVIWEDKQEADFIYSRWQAPLITDNKMTIFVNKMIEHYEHLYGVKAKG